MAMIGWFSRMEELKLGSTLYRTRNGGVVEVTRVADETDLSPPDVQQWGDYVNRGIVLPIPVTFDLSSDALKLKLTGPQRAELLRVMKERQNTYGAARTRIQNTLVRMGLARYASRGSDEFCEITDPGAVFFLKTQR